MNLEITQPALRLIADALRETPFDGKVWMVGGAVRDTVLFGSEIKDIDLCTTLDASELVDLLWNRGLADHSPTHYGRFGTAMVHVAGEKIEVAITRKESYSETSRKPEVEPATLQEDAHRRDFTINALYWNLSSQEIEDPTGMGFKDAEAKVLRTPLNPESTFSEDPLRMFRAVRFRSRLGYAYAEGLADAIRASAHRVEILSPERIRDELNQILMGPRRDQALQDLLELGLLAEVLPELPPMIGVTQGSYHKYDVWDHTRAVVAAMEASRPVEAWAALLHDVAKPITRSIDDEGRIRFFTHELKGADMARAILNRLRFSADEIDEVALLVRNHMRLGNTVRPTPTVARRLLRDLGESLDSFFALLEADARGMKSEGKDFNLEPYREATRQVLSTTKVEMLDSPLDGKELMERFNREPGPWIKAVKARLTDAVLDGEIEAGDKDAAWALVEREGLVGPA
ncbi:MAG: CCA tRNA nucleotidyltransferase [Armatimonadetes bacterium]|nr:CCA tRNA nucleotidyltransferase [Armatimonadota bacterium]